MADFKSPIANRYDDLKNFKRSSNFVLVVMAILGTYLLVFGTTKASAIMTGVAIASIPLFRLLVKSAMVAETGIDIVKVSAKGAQRVTEAAEKLIEITEEQNKIIERLMDEGKPIKLDIENKGDLIMTLIEAEKIKVTYGGQSDYATPVSLGMVDKRKNPSLYWGYIKLFCQYGGYMNFNLNHNYLDKKVANRIQQQLSRFRTRLGEALGVEIESSDYKFDKGEWTWVTFNWRDEFSTHQEKLARQEKLEMMKEAEQAGFIKSIRSANLATGEQKDRDNDPSIDELDEFDEENYYDDSDTPSWDRKE
jgi:uncharacterized membrane protein